MIRWVLLLLLLCAPLFSNAEKELYKELKKEGITVDLRNPILKNGALTTSEGGVIQSENIRIQARCIRYIQKEGENSLEAEGDLLISFGDYLFTGDSITYDFKGEYGEIVNGRTAIEPWYFSGQLIRIYGQKCIQTDQGMITTSECDPPEWSIKVKRAVVDEDHVLTARGVSIHLFRLPLFWFPVMRMNLDNLFDSPIRYRVRWGEEQGLRFGMIYRAFEINNFIAYLRFDYRLQRGPGGGLETHYINPNKENWLHTISYVANDSSIQDPKLQTRYRLEGTFHDEWDRGQTSLDLSYDYLSDQEMPTDYEDNGLLIASPQRTQLNFRRQQDQIAVSNFFTRVRLNNFQTIKQELPSFSTIFHPFLLNHLGVISDNQVSIGYLYFKYSDCEDFEEPCPGPCPPTPFLPPIDYHAWRCQFFHRLYRPFKADIFTFTPDAQAIAIFYSQNPNPDKSWLALGSFGAELKTTLNKVIGPVKHVLEPYSSYRIMMNPTIIPIENYIFDITDGWYEMDNLRLGIRNLIYYKPNEQVISPVLTLDMFSYLFFNTPTINTTIPKVYLDVEFNPSYTWRHQWTTAWDTQRNQFSFFNYWLQVTVNENAAFSFEFRSRNAWDWRKSQYFNFVLDSFESEEVLRANPFISDRRNTLLGNFFLKFDPSMAVQFQIRHGWNRERENQYTEYETDLYLFLRGAWQFRISFQKLVEDHRFTMYFNLGGQKPRQFRSRYD